MRVHTPNSLRSSTAVVVGFVVLGTVAVRSGVVSLITTVDAPPDSEPLVPGLEGCGALQPVAVGMDRVLLHERNGSVRLFYVGIDQVVEEAAWSRADELDAAVHPVDAP